MSEQITPPVLYETHATVSGQHIGIATLNSEKSLNALSYAMVQSLSAQLAYWAKDDSIVAVWLQGAGEKAFCAGGDIRAMYETAKAHPGELTDAVEQFFTEEYRLDYQIHRFPKPFIVWGSGIVMGGGLGLMAGASHRLVTETSRIAMPEISIGLFPDVGATYFLNRMPGHCGRFLGLTAYNMSGADACYVGLGDHLVASNQRQVLLEQLGLLPWSTNHSNNRQLVSNMFDGYANTAVNGQLEQSQPLIDELFGGASIGVLMADLAAYNTELPWLQRALKTALAGSPITAHLVWHQLQHGSNWCLEQVFQSELVWAVRCAQLGDFVEGVRALLIDKDRNPQWRYANVNEVNSALFKQIVTNPWQRHPLERIEESAL
ncbi:enoyl-CoA hydratase/isomerase family protein [Ferrimonas lipolytica]|uniref:3-hydroxyisobutyryl-CoA hydrolase n=1 Tax=Ferrimonas lipolytica TaxID=2724191 RepID=A0A6H1UEA8_9GAMM|nr:enoyl-CoA hydratase/isomerase family protein [Ferrimonas lipolytica]QIZ77425.1 enoyl-CoA hydratase/isomerase family protein [Ferrimonas lipolytica]